MTMKELRRLPVRTIVSSVVHMLAMSSDIGAIGWKKRLERWSGDICRMPEADGTGPVTAIVLSYKRPQNISPIVEALLRTPSVGSVVVSNHNCSVSSAGLFRSHPRVRVLENDGRDSYYRFFIASGLSGEFFLGVDDDVFLRPEQLETVCKRLKADPSVPHGVCGQFRTDSGFISGIIRYEGRMDVINRVYAFTKMQAQKVVKQHDAHWSEHDNCMWDDILLSTTGRGKPMCWNVGSILMCPTSREQGVALCRREDFSRKREEAFGLVARSPVIA